MYYYCIHIYKYIQNAKAIEKKSIITKSMHQSQCSYNFEMKVTALTKQLLQCRQLRQIHREDPNFATILKEFPQTLDGWVHGFHQSCKQAFTNFKYIREDTTLKHKWTGREKWHRLSNPQPQSQREESQTLNAPKILFPADTCIICDKKQKR